MSSYGETWAVMVKCTRGKFSQNRRSRLWYAACKYEQGLLWQRKCQRMTCTSFHPIMNAVLSIMTAFTANTCTLHFGNSDRGRRRSTLEIILNSVKDPQPPEKRGYSGFSTRHGSSAQQLRRLGRSYASCSRMEFCFSQH